MSELWQKAVDPDRAVSQYLRESWSSERGYPGGPIHGITQTPDGYLWIAAERGLVRFDGVEFRLFEYLPAGSSTGAATPSCWDAARSTAASTAASSRTPSPRWRADGAYPAGA